MTEVTGKEEHCSGCRFRLMPGMYLYRVAGRPYCQGCVAGPVIVTLARPPQLPRQRAAERIRA